MEGVAFADDGVGAVFDGFVMVVGANGIVGHAGSAFGYCGGWQAGDVVGGE